MHSYIATCQVLLMIVQTKENKISTSLLSSLSLSCLALWAFLNKKTHSSTNNIVHSDLSPLFQTHRVASLLHTLLSKKKPQNMKDFISAKYIKRCYAYVHEQSVSCVTN